MISDGEQLAVYLIGSSPENELTTGPAHPERSYFHLSVLMPSFGGVMTYAFAVSFRLGNNCQFFSRNNSLGEVEIYGYLISAIII
jgi:hypothetical protein